MKGRKLRPDEQALWDGVARSTTPLGHRARNTAQNFPPKPQKKNGKREVTEGQGGPKPIAPFEITGRRAPADVHVHTAPPIADRLHAAPVNMDFKTYKRMTRGKLSPEARIDLHGMTIAEAQPALTGFIFTAHARGLRLVLVITGKGRRGDDNGAMPQRLGILRHEAPIWLGRPPLGMIVQQVTPANARHGGHGAYYVYLRRK